MHLKIQAVVEFGLYDKLNYELTPVTMTLCYFAKKKTLVTVTLCYCMLLFSAHEKNASVSVNYEA